ncbi:MAG: recombinase family protein [Bacilli bacterium]
MSIENKNYKVGLYIRLSREDDDKTQESESIKNQRSLLLQYVKENNLTLVDVYIDDGFSGTNFDRPDFNRMIRDIELNRINMIITKDMSRLGRDYIGTGNLIEKYFPEHGVRYIAVTDNIDTFLDSTNNDIAPFRAIMNDMYAKDISKKIKSSIKAKQKEGKWVSGRTPFGYMHDKKDKNKLVISEEQAKVVRRIYDLCLNGLSFYKIALVLSNEKVKSPAQYYDFKWNNTYNASYGMWNAKTISDILKSEIYTGDLIQNKRSKVNYKVKKIVKNSPKDYIISKNTHEAIIDKNTFQEVQKKIPKNVGRHEKKEEHLLDALLYCGDCGHRISIRSRRKVDNNCYTICNYYRTYMKYHVCTTHSNNYDILEKVIIDKLKGECLDYVDRKSIKRRIIEESKHDNKISIKSELETLKKEIKVINDNLDFIYIDKLNKNISNEQYDRVRVKLENDINTKQKRIDELESNLNENIDNDNSQKVIEKYIDECLSMKNPSRELIVNLIDKIIIYSDKKIDIKLPFNNFF